MDEIIEKLYGVINHYEDELEKLSEFQDFFPEMAAEIALRREEIEGFIETIDEILDDCV